MKKEKKNILIGFIFLIYALIVPAYIYTYKSFSPVFWIVFCVERLISILYSKKIQEFLENTEETDFERHLTYFMVFLALITIIIFIYIILNYPKLFILILIGESLDRCFEKIQQSVVSSVKVEHAQYKK